MQHSAGKAWRMVARSSTGCFLATPQYYSDSTTGREALERQQHQSEFAGGEGTLRATGIIEQRGVVASGQRKIKFACRVSFIIDIAA